MKPGLINRLLLPFGLVLLLTIQIAKAQSTQNQSIVDYYELKGLLLRHKATVESMLSLKQFKLDSRKERPESTIYTFKKDKDTTQILVRIRKGDDLTSEIAWHEESSTLAYLTHDAIADGFVPVNGNSRYYNRFQKMALLINYPLASHKGVPCLLRAVD